MVYKTMQDAFRLGLIQLTVWLPKALPQEKEFVERECKRIASDPERKAVIVEQGACIAVFVDPVAEVIQ